MTAGIYSLNFIGTDKLYIGQSKNIEKRYKEHLSSLVYSTASSKMLQAYITYGTPLYNILLECTEKDNIKNIEQEYILKFNCIKNGFNTMSNSATSPEFVGENCPRSLYSNAQIEQVFNILVDAPTLSHSEISKITGVSISTIAQVSSGNTHKWLSEKYPDKYKTLLELKINRRELKQSVKTMPSTTSKYTDTQYLKVLTLAVQGYKAKDINKLTEVNIDVIRDITSCRRHKWLETADSVNYSKLKQIKGK